MKKIVLASALVALMSGPALTYPVETGSSYLAQLKTTIANMSWQKKVLVGGLSTIIVGLVLKKTGFFSALTDMFFGKREETAVANERLEDILENFKKCKKQVKKCKQLSPQLVKNYILAAAKNELKTRSADNVDNNSVRAIIQKYLGLNLHRERTDPVNGLNVHLHLFSLTPIPAVRNYWGSTQFKSTEPRDSLNVNYDDYKEINSQYECTADPIVKDDKTLKKQIANIYKIHIMPPSENVTDQELNSSKTRQSFIDTDLAAAADIVVTVLRLIKENEKFRDCIFEFKFISALSIPRNTGEVYPLIVLYLKPDKKYAQTAADILYEELNIKQKNPNHTYLTPRSNARFCKDKPIYYILGDGQARAYKTQYGKWVDEVYDGPFFKKEFVGVSKEKQMLQAPKK